MAGGRRTEAERRRELMETSTAMHEKVFPEVPEVDPLELYSALAPGPKAGVDSLSTGGAGEGLLRGKKVIVVDTRSDAECDVSMIPGGALRQRDFEARCDEFSDFAVVCYCTVGLRSGKYAAKLRKEMEMDATNLRGSLLAWTHARLPLTETYSSQHGSGPLNPPAAQELGGEKQGVGEGYTTKLHVYNELFALQADGYEPVTFPPNLVSRLASVLPTWVIPKLGGWG